MSKFSFKAQIILKFIFIILYFSIHEMYDEGTDMIESEGVRYV